MTGSCPICFESPAVVETTCHHYFCKACLSTWLKHRCTCPLCRELLQPPTPSGTLAGFEVCIRLYRVRFDPLFSRRLRLTAAVARRLRMPWWLTIDGGVLKVWMGRVLMLSRACYDVARMINGDVDTALHVRLGDKIAAVRWQEDAEVSGSVREWFQLAFNSD